MIGLRVFKGFRKVQGLGCLFKVYGFCIGLMDSFCPEACNHFLFLTAAIRLSGFAFVSRA